MKTIAAYLQFIYSKMKNYKNHNPVTFEYPYSNKHIHVFTRLEIQNDFPECSACGICSESCPVDAIHIAGEHFSKQVKKPRTIRGIEKQMNMTAFEIDYSKCVFCALCIKDCPTGSLTNSKKFVRAEEEIRQLNKDLMQAIKPNFRGIFKQ